MAMTQDEDPEDSVFDNPEDVVEAKQEQAKKAAQGISGGLPQRALTDDEMKKLAEAVLAFCMQMTGIELYPYEQEFAWRVIYSLVSEDAEEITALFSRQSGKTETVAVVVSGCMVLLPLLAQILEHDERISKFKDGLWCGIYAPNYEQAGIMWSRMKVRMYSKTAKQTLLDPDININLMDRSENMTLPNGSFCDCGTASPQASIEGKTYHLILLEETQDISDDKLRASIHPMAAATAGTLVKIGTCNRRRSDFYGATRRNKRSDVAKGLLRSRERNHFEYDYTVAQRYNPRYLKYVAKERDRLGEDSDDFRMKYKLHWLLERGMFVNPDLFDECGISDSDKPLKVVKGKGRRSRTITFSRPPNVVTYDIMTPDLVFAIDVGRAKNSTVVTVGKVFWDSPIAYGDETRYPIHVYNWLELHGDDHESQHSQIVDFLKNYRVSMGIVDATGKGDPVYARLAAELASYGIDVRPFIFSAQSKDVGYKVLLQEIQARRLTFPSGAKATRLRKWQAFCAQMYDLEKDWRGGMMVVSAPRAEDAHDDYPDSLMMLSWIVNVRGTMEVEQTANPFVGRLASNAASDMMRRAGAWYRSAMGPNSRSNRQDRSSKRGRFD